MLARHRCSPHCLAPNHPHTPLLLALNQYHKITPTPSGWFAAAPLLGGYGKDARGGAVGPAALAAAKCWAAGMPLALAVRGLSKGYMPPTPFILISLAATAVLMVGWRAALAAATPEVRCARVVGVHSACVYAGVCGVRGMHVCPSVLHGAGCVRLMGVVCRGGLLHCHIAGVAGWG